MKTLTEKYRGVLNESFSKAQFIRDAQIAYPHLITKSNGFGDTVTILKQKGMISEEDKMPEYAEFHNYSDETIRRGIDYELAGMGLMPEDSVSAEDQAKAKNKVFKNLKKDPLHYLNLVSGESNKVDKHDKMVEPTDKNKVDTFNGMKKAELKESYDANNDLNKMDFSKLNSGQKEAFDVWIVQYAEGYFDNKAELQDMIDKFAEIENANDLEDLVHADFAGDKGERQIFIRQLEKAYLDDDQPLDETPVNEYDQTDAVADYIIKHYTNPKTGKSLIDDETVSDFYRTHPEWEEQADGSEEGMQAVLDNFENYLLANYDFPGSLDEKIAKSVDDVIDPADYGMIGQGYLKGFNRPHSLDADQLETLGRKVVDSLYKGDFDKAKAKFVKEVMGIDRLGRPKPKDTSSNYTGGAANMKMKEQMTDQEMADIAKYGREDKPVKAFKPGDNWSDDFDYEGMLEFGMKIRLNTPVQTLKALYSSFEDVNYHTENSHLGMAIDAIEAKDKSEALDHIRNFKKAIKQTLVQFNEGANPNRRELEEADAVISERVGALQEFISLIEDRAAENGTTEAEEAEEVMYALGEHYNLGVDIMHPVSEGLFDRIKAKASGAMASIGQKGKNFLSYMKGDKDAIKDPVVAKAFAKVASTAKNLQNQATGVMKDLESLFPKETLDKLPAEAQEAFKQYHATIKAAVDQSATMAQLKEDDVSEKKGKDHDGDGDVDGDDYMAAKDKAIKKAMGKDEIVKENIKSIISKVLEEQIINEAATQELAKMADSYAGFEGMKAVVMSLQDIVTDIERYYDNTRSKIQKAFNSMGEVRNEEGLKVGGFLSPAVESAFNKDLRPAIKKGFTKGLEQPKVKVLSQADLDAARMGGSISEVEPKQTVYSPVQEEKKQKKEKDIKHDCANHVLHEKYGHGVCLEEQHTLLEDGTVTHYDVFFKEGSKTVKNIPTEELKIITSSHHGHKRKKK